MFAKVLWTFLGTSMIHGPQGLRNLCDNCSVKGHVGNSYNSLADQSIKILLFTPCHCKIKSL